MKRYHGQEILGDAVDGAGNLIDGFYYLISVCLERGSDYWDFSKEPGRKNMSHEICTDGWLGSTNNVARYARGAVCVKNGRVSKCQVEELVRAEECAEEVLDSVG